MEKALVVYIFDQTKLAGFQSWGEELKYHVITSPDSETLDKALEKFDVVKCVIDANYSRSIPQSSTEEKVRFLFDSTDTGFTKKIFGKFVSKYGSLATQMFKAITDNPSCIYEAYQCGIPIVEQLNFPFIDFFEIESRRKEC